MGGGSKLGQDPAKPESAAETKSLSSKAEGMVSSSRESGPVQMGYSSACVSWKLVLNGLCGMGW